MRSLPMFVCLAVFAIWNGTFAFADTAKTLYLTNQYPSSEPVAGDKDAPVTTSLAYREIVRQAVLMCARNKFGLVTRDATLREPMPEDLSSSDLFDLKIRTISGKRVEYELLQAGKTLTKGELKYNFAHDASGLSILSNTVHEWAMEDLPKVLEAAGYKRMELKKGDLEDTTIPADIADNLLSMNVLSQFLAVRLAHKEITENGETLGLLSALVQGYGNLCQLTEFHPMQMRVAFYARAVLYGSRMIKLKPESPIGYWYRGYAYMLSGRSQDGQWDFEKAATLTSDIAKPDWFTLMEPVYQFNFQTLKKEAEAKGKQQQLAVLLWYRSVEFSGSQYLNLTVGKQCLSLFPRSTRIINGMHNVAGVSYGHQTSLLGMRQFAALMHEVMPVAIKQDEQIHHVLIELANPMHTLAGLAEVRDALLEAAKNDTHELSLATLAQLIDEEVMTSIINRVTFLRDSLGVDSTQFIDQTRIFYKGHPHAPLVDACRYKKWVGQKYLTKFLSDYEVSDANFYTVHKRLLLRLYGNMKLKEITAKEYRRLIWRSCTSRDSDYLTHDFVAYAPQTALKYAGWMEGMFPNAPLRHRIYVIHDWESRKEDPEWLENHGAHPVVSAAIANKYVEDGEFKAAVKWYEKSIAGAPEYKSYLQLAAIYWNHLDDKERAIEIAEEFLLQEDFGLQHSSFSSTIAYSLLSQGKNQEALIWGARAAESYSGRGLRTLANCQEAVGQLDEALSTYQAMDERYDLNRTYSFVLRTKHGELKPTWRQLQKKRPTVSDYTRKKNESYHALYSQNHKKALGLFLDQQAVDGKPVSLLTLHAAALADELSDHKQRDALWQQIADLPPKLCPVNSKNARHKKLAQLLLQVQKNELPDFDTVNDLDPNTYHDTYAEMHYFFGAFCEVHGHKKRAVQHYREAAKTTFQQNGVVINSWIRLRALGEDPFAAQPFYWSGLAKYARPK